MTDPNTVTSKDFLTQLLAEVEETDAEMLPPPQKVKPGEKVIGIIYDPYIRKVMSLCSFYRREAQRLQVDLEAAGEQPKRSVTHNQLKQKHETLMEIFWLLARSHMNCWGVDVGIRRGWEVVDTTNVKDSPIDVLKRILNDED